MLFEIPPFSSDQVNINTVLIAVVAAIVTLVTPFITARVVASARSQDRLDRVAEREQDRADRATVAEKVDKVAEVAKGTTATIARIEATGKATHKIVNNQRTQMLRQIAVLTRAAAKDHPEDQVLQDAALAADSDLAANVKENADPETKDPASA